MQPRATHILAQLPDAIFLEAIASGLRLTAEWIQDLERAAARLDPTESGGAEVLQVVANEEAGKYLILVDAVRCPRTKQKPRTRQLKRSNDHLAKGIYSTVVDYSAGTYDEFVGYFEHLRLSHYLDGPNDTDWIFRNEIEANREQRLYVDFVQTDDGSRWWEPQRYDRLGGLSSVPSNAVEIVLSLDRLGLGTPEGVRVLAETWRPFSPGGSTWSELTETMERMFQGLINSGVLTESPAQADLSRLLDRWPWPLYDAEMSKIDVDLDELRQRQANHIWD
jgi:hypothetical protein